MLDFSAEYVYKGNRYSLISKSKMKLSCGSWADAVIYAPSGSLLTGQPEIYVRRLSDFLAKFTVSKGEIMDRLNSKMTTGPMNAENCKMNAADFAPRDTCVRAMTQEEQDRWYLIGKNVLFAPPQECKGDKTPDFYPATITKVNGPSDGFGGVRTVDLVTFGPNSIYFQHNIPFSGHGIKAGHWFYKD